MNRPWSGSPTGSRARSRCRSITRSGGGSSPLAGLRTPTTIMSVRRATTIAMLLRRCSPISSPPRCGSKPSIGTNGCVLTSRATTTTRTCSCSGFGSRGEPSAFAQQALGFFAQFGRDVGTRERVGDVRGEKADLGTAVIALAFELQAIERLLLGELDHRVGQLDLAAGATVLRRQDGEDFGLQDVAAGDDEVRRRLRARRLLHHPRDAE